MFGSLGRILGKTTGIKIQPFKGKVKVGAPMQGLNTGDFLTLSSLFLPGGNLANLGKTQLKDLSLGNVAGNLNINKLLNNPAIFASALGGSKAGGTGDNSQSLYNTSSLLKQLTALQPGVDADIQSLLKSGDLRRQISTNAVNSLTPSSRQAAIDGEKNRLQSQAMRRVSKAAATLGSKNTGYLEGLKLDAINRATEAGNQLQAGLNEPAAVANAALQQLGLLGEAEATPALDKYQQIMSLLMGVDQNRAALRANREPTLLERLLPLAGQVDWGQLLKQLK